MPLTDIERLTPQNFFAALAPRLRFGGREFDRVDWLEAVGDSGGMVQMVGRLIPPKDQGTVRVPVVVSIVPWGKDWKAALPLELQAQIDDLRTGRVNPRRPAPRQSRSGAGHAGGRAASRHCEREPAGDPRTARRRREEPKARRTATITTTSR